jgi:hypothetical protein
VGTDRFTAAGDAQARAGRGTRRSPPVRLREIVQEWTLRSTQAELGNIFNNARVLFLSGTHNYRLASVIAESTDNLSFADPIVQFGLPNLLHTLPALERYAAGSHPILRLEGGSEARAVAGAASVLQPPAAAARRKGRARRRGHATTS